MSEVSPQVQVKPVPEPQYEFLDPKKLRLFRDDSGWVRLEIAGDRCYLDVKVVRTFPLSDPDNYFGFLDAKDRVIGVVVEPKELEQESREVAFKEVSRRYFSPIIKRIDRMKEEFGVVYCDVETDHGPRQFVVRGIRDSLLDLGGGELLIIDVDGNRYRIDNLHRMDAKSRRLLERVV